MFSHTSFKTLIKQWEYNKPQSSDSKQIIQKTFEYTFYKEIKSLNINNIPYFTKKTYL